MSYEEDDRVILKDKHHERDGEEGRVVQISETMFGDQSYSIEIEGERIAGLGPDQLEKVEEDEEENEEE